MTRAGGLALTHALYDAASATSDRHRWAAFGNLGAGSLTMIDIDKTGFHYCRNLRHQELHASATELAADDFTLGPIDAVFSPDNKFL